MVNIDFEENIFFYFENEKRIASKDDPLAVLASEHFLQLRQTLLGIADQQRHTLAPLI